MRKEGGSVRVRFRFKAVICATLVDLVCNLKVENISHHSSLENRFDIHCINIQLVLPTAN